MAADQDLDSLWEVVREGDRAGIEALLIGVRARTVSAHCHASQSTRPHSMRSHPLTTRALAALLPLCRMTITRRSACPSTCATSSGWRRCTGSRSRATPPACSGSSMRSVRTLSARICSTGRRRCTLQRVRSTRVWRSNCSGCAQIQWPQTGTAGRLCTRQRAPARPRSPLLLAATPAGSVNVEGPAGRPTAPRGLLGAH